MNTALNDDTELHRIKEAFAHHGEYVRTTEELANIAGVSTERMQLALDEQLDSLENYRAKLHASGALRPDRANRALDQVVATIQIQLDKGVDGFEAAELSKPLIRILENYDRVRLAEREKDPHAGLPVFNIIFHRAGGMTMEPTAPETRVLDVSGALVKTLQDRGQYE